MKILVLNRGSSTIKCCLYDFKTAPLSPLEPLWEGVVEWKNAFEKVVLRVKKGREQHEEIIVGKTAAEALSSLVSFLIQGKTAVLDSLDEIAVIGHRIVHGGKEFEKSVLITTHVKEKIRALSGLAPLHNLPELEGIEILEQLFKKTPQIAVFDTAFHRTLPQAAQVYPGPFSWYEEGIQRYGFHGISHQYCARRAAELLKRDLSRLRMVVCHLGSGASLCAIKGGKSVDTTMGFTPLEGLMMDTRSGSIDPGIILYLLEKKHKSTKEVSQELYERSGLLGISGSSSDMRDIIETSLQGNLRASLAFEVYLHRLSACLGAMIASLEGIDALIFTAGIGENASLLRERICSRFAFLGVKLDQLKNEQSLHEDGNISAEDAKVHVLVIHTQEAFEIARDCWKLISSGDRDG